MKKIQITQGKTILVDDEDFEILSQWKWSLSNGYATRRLKRLNGKQRDQKMHRFLMGEPKGKQIDHINGNKLDNRKSNLRICSIRQNRYNMPQRSDNKSGYKGVYWCNQAKKWIARIRFENRLYYLGRFTDPKLAAFAYDKAALKFFKEFAFLNFNKIQTITTKEDLNGRNHCSTVTE